MREIEGSKIDSEVAECNHPLYSSVQEQGVARVLITILASDHSVFVFVFVF